MADSFTRRRFLESTSGMIGISAAGVPLPSTLESGPSDAGEFASRWHRCHDRTWLGPEYWANPLQDWRIVGGRVECVRAAPNRNVQLLTRQLGEKAGDLRMAVRIGRKGGAPLGRGRGSFGFRIGIQGPLRDYRNSLVFGTGVDAGVTSDGRLFVGELESIGAGRVDLAREAIELRLEAKPFGDHYEVDLVAADPTTERVLSEFHRGGIAADQLVGNLALVANYAERGSEQPAASKTKAGGKPAPAGMFWFADWRVAGSKVLKHDDHAFGPIFFAQYTLSRGTLKLTAQMPPLGDQDSRTVQLQIPRNSGWTTLAEEPIHAEARTATFRVAGWNARRDCPYRLAYTLRSTDGTTEDHHWAGTVRRDPIDAPVLTVADVSCNAHFAFPNSQYVAHMARLDPDLLTFTGDQFYESSGGYGIQRAPLDAAILDLLRRWYLHGWTWRELLRDRPSISIPDDHDVYQGNIWGEGGAPRRGTQEMGGYEMPPAWVNVVHRTQTSHHPDFYDPTPAARGISVYYGTLTYGRVSFAIIADRQFKSGPEGKVPPTGGRGDHVVDPHFDPKSADVPGLDLLGERQLAFVRAWAADWRGADMKAVVSQSIFTAMATTHGPGRERLRADYDTNAWPQTARNASLREIRKAFAFHIAGDQHLPAVVHYGIDAPGDAAVAFAGPAVNNLYPRWWEPERPGRNRLPGGDEKLGDFTDSFGHPLTVRAVANPALVCRTGVLEFEHDKAAGLGIVRFDKKKRTITIECWPFLADPSRPGSQFPGWPVVVSQLENYGRQPVAYLPRLMVRGTQDPVVQVIDESSGEIIYTLRIAGHEFTPPVSAPGRYRVMVSDPDAGRIKEVRALVAQARNTQTLEIELDTFTGSAP